MSNKRVVFPFAEAGMGHIIPMRGIADAFEHNYGDRVDCLRSRFLPKAAMRVSKRSKNVCAIP